MKAADGGALSPLVRAAARGEMPDWSVASPARRGHIARVAALLDAWASQLELDADEHARWVAVGWLHDALRDAPADRLREMVPAEFGRLPGSVLHGPAAAEMLRPHADDRLLQAIRYHTIGHPGLDDLGKALYLADFLEPGREFEREWRATLRSRMPGELPTVLLEVLGARIQHLIEVRKPIRPETAGFWSAAVAAE